MNDDNVTKVDNTIHKPHLEVKEDALKRWRFLLVAVEMSPSIFLKIKILYTKRGNSNSIKN